MCDPDAIAAEAGETQLCDHEGCRRLAGHDGAHTPFATEAWGFMRKEDSAKLSKAGFATPRGGDKGGYQNHVSRSSRVIIPFEVIDDARFTPESTQSFTDGFIVRFRPDQCFDKPGVLKSDLKLGATPLVVGNNAFVLYRGHDELREFPPLKDWVVRSLVKDDAPVDTRRGKDVEDRGHYILRLPKAGGHNKVSKGPAQGIFAPEYADIETNFLAKCVLAWLIVHTVRSPYTTTEAEHLKAILRSRDLLADDVWEKRGVLRRGLAACPLCTRLIAYDELHQMIEFGDESGLSNASSQVAGATRSTVVNLFHLEPLLYKRLDHTPNSVAWGHATCNTRLGQRRCFSVQELISAGHKVGLVLEDRIETFGWMSADWEMIRSPLGSVWIRISEDREGEDDVGPPPPDEADPLDA